MQSLANTRWREFANDENLKNEFIRGLRENELERTNLRAISEKYRYDISLKDKQIAFLKSENEMLKSKRGE